MTPTRTIVSGGVVFFAHAGEFGPNLYDLVPDPPALDNYMLDASIGPLFAFGLLNQWTALPLIDTSGGILIFRQYWSRNRNRLRCWPRVLLS